MIKIELKDKAFEPGDQIAGTVRWKSLLPNESLEIRLIWYTVGKGDQDVGIAGTQAVPQPNENDETPFSFVAPFYPQSFSGALISLKWAIEVVLFLTKDAERCDIVIAHHRQEILLHCAKK